MQLFPKNVRDVIHWQIFKSGFAKVSKRGFISFIESPPSFSMQGSAKTKATIASRIGTARGTGQKSERSYLVGDLSPTQDQLSAGEEAWWRSVSSRRG